VLSILFIFIGCKGGRTGFYIWHIGLGRDEGFLKRYLRDQRIKFPARLHSLLVMEEKRPLRRQPEGHHFGSPLILAVTAVAFPLVTWVATKAVLFFLQESPIP